MVALCPVCGSPLGIENPKFCPECGARLVGREDRARAPAEPSQAKTGVPDIPPAADESGAPATHANLGDIVGEIFRKDGYSTRCKVQIPGRGLYKNEIDIVAEKGEEKVAIECKDHAAAVGIGTLRDFAQKIEDLGPGWRGVFIACNDITAEADDFAASRNIEVIDPGEIKEKWFALSTGKTGVRGEHVLLEYALPAAMDYDRATFLNLVNRSKVQVQDAKLVFHPYFLVRYAYHAVINDPGMNVHTFDDKGTVIIDALDGKILNPPEVGRARALGKAVKNIISPAAHEEKVRSAKLLREITEETPAREYSLTIGGEYRVIRLMAETTPRDAEKAAIDHVIEKNIQSIEYEIDGAGGRKESRKREFVPRREDITFSTDVVLIPKWTVHFGVLGLIYTREVFACSGEVLEDTLENCPLHTKLGSLAVKKKTGAVCEVCGRAYCREHIHSCSSCGKWLCTDHTITCSSCGRDFCAKHAPIMCPLCDKALCGGCVTTCPGCGRISGSNHLLECEDCGRKFCPDCLVREGVLRKKRICRTCREERSLT